MLELNKIVLEAIPLLAENLKKDVIAYITNMGKRKFESSAPNFKL